MKYSVMICSDGYGRDLFAENIISNMNMQKWTKDEGNHVHDNKH